MRLVCRLSTGLIFLLGLTDCAPQIPKKIAAGQSAQVLLARRLQNADVHEFVKTALGHDLNWPLAVWDPDLLTLAAFHYNHDLMLARAHWQTVQAAVMTAGERPNPTLGVLPELVTNPGGLSPWISAFNLDVPIETAGKRHLRVEQTTQAALAARLQVITATWQVRARVQTALSALYVAQHKENFLQDEDTALTEYAGILNDRTRQGMVAQKTATESEVTRDEVHVADAQAKLQVDQARAELAAALGVPLSALDTVKLSYGRTVALLSSRGTTAPAVIRLRALTSRSDILAALADYASCDAGLRLELAKRWPDLNLNPGYQWSQGENHWTLGLTVTLPIFNQNQGAIAEATARCHEQEVNFDALQARVLADLDRIWIAYRDQLAILRAADILAASQQRRFDLLTQSLDPGEFSRGVLAFTRRDRDAAQLTRLDALADTLKTLADLEAATETPLRGLGKLPGLDEMIFKTEQP
jgi:cobalt-zinc-cadmium efflux system outer membrane protein